MTNRVIGFIISAMQAKGISINDAVSALGVGNQRVLTRIMVAVCDEGVNGQTGQPP